MGAIFHMNELSINRYIYLDFSLYLFILYIYECRLLLILMVVTNISSRQVIGVGRVHPSECANRSEFTGPSSPSRAEFTGPSSPSRAEFTGPNLLWAEFTVSHQACTAYSG